jgi:hypothetical protein
MKHRNVMIIVLFGVLTIALLLYFVFNNQGKRYNWYETYRVDSDQPYGTLFLQKMLQHRGVQRKVTISDKQPLERFLEKHKTGKNADYVFVGESLYLDEAGVTALTQFMDKGGDAFISALEPPLQVVNAVYINECGQDIYYENNRADSVDLNFFHDTLKTKRDLNYVFRIAAYDRPYSWSYVGAGVFCDSTRNIIPLGYQAGGHVNFLRIPVGKGNLYLHSNPLVFTNYFLTQQQKVDYASGVFSHLDGNEIIWDEYSKVPSLTSSNEYDSPLYYIMQQPSLKYAWWLLLFTVILYILFGSKRKQRVIPVLEAKTNTSLEYVKLISRLHYQNGNHVDMARKKMKYFLYFVRSKYGIQLESFKEENIRRLAEKSRVAIADVEVIFRQYSLIEEKFRHSIEANRLVDLYYAIDNFYKQCK